jgi:nucleoside-diphosphate-sugar epimerase
VTAVLVTGGGGFIGAHAAARFRDEGYDVYCVDPLKFGLPADPVSVANLRYRYDVLLAGTQLFRASTEYDDEIRRVLRDLRPRYVVHLGGVSQPAHAVASIDRAFDSMARGTLNILRAAAEAHVAKLVFVSTSMVYGDFGDAPVAETRPANPKDVYGAMKLVGEVLVKAFRQTHGLPYVIVRTSAVYGPTDVNGRVVQRLVEAAAYGSPCTLRNAETTRLDFTYVADLAEGLTRAVASPVANDVFNVTAGDARTLAELYDVVAARAPGVEVEFANGHDFRPQRGTLDIRKAREVLGYEPQYRLEDGIDEYLAFARSVAPAAAAPAAAGA